MKDLTQSKRNSGKEHDSKVEDTRYYGAIPSKVLKEMTPEIIEQYYIWDEVVKKEVERYPWLILPLVQEVFHKTYPVNISIRLIATEYVVRRIHKDGGSTLNSIFADIAVQIGDRDIYHIECQMNKDKEMVLRMLEYDIHIGLVYGTGSSGKAISAENRYELVLPRSIILYLDHTDSISAEEICLIRFADGTTHKYRVPVMNVQNYTIEMIEKKHLNMLIPFLPIRFRKCINRKKNNVRQPVPDTVRKDLTEFIQECIMIIDREKENGTLTDAAGREIIEFLDITCGYLLKSEPDLKKEVHEIMKPIVMLQSERAEYEIKLISKRFEEEAERIKREMREAKKEKNLHSERNENAIRKLVEKNHLTGLSRKEAKDNIQDIFSLGEEEAEEKMEKYWVQAGEK